MSQKKFYITTTLPYVNAPLHLGHAVEIIRADAIARYQKLQGHEVFFNTGTDEHGQKIFEAAQKAGKSVVEYTDYFANLFKETVQKFGVSDDIKFIRTTDKKHILAAQTFWKICADKNFIYKKKYKAKYCVGCEEEKTDSELVDGRCPVHLDRELEILEEENYFFKLSEFGDQLLKYYDEHPDFILPNHRMNEMREFIKSGLRDFSISRLKSKMSWGIPVPDDNDHVIYVWFDALINYISTLGWPNELSNFEKFWSSHDSKTVQYCGKDNTRFQGVMWQAMLMAAGIKNTDQIIIDGFILGEGGIKMSKTLGNIINPLEIINKYGTDVLRYFSLRNFHPFEDTAVSQSSLLESYNSNLANGLGNLISRVMRMTCDNLQKIPDDIFEKILPPDFCFEMDNFNIKNACDMIWFKINQADKIIQETEPFKLIKTQPDKAKEILIDLLKRIWIIAVMLEPIMPETSEKICQAIKQNTKPENLFSRI